MPSIHILRIGPILHLNLPLLLNPPINPNIPPVNNLNLRHTMMSPTPAITPVTYGQQGHTNKQSTENSQHNVSSTPARIPSVIVVARILGIIVGESIDTISVTIATILQAVLGDAIIVIHFWVFWGFQYYNFVLFVCEVYMSGNCQDIICSTTIPKNIWVMMIIGWAC